MAVRAARTDQNQREIVTALRKAGASVLPLHAVGRGCPDLLVGHWCNRLRWSLNTLMEVKRPPGPRGGMKDRGLTPDQQKFHATWKGRIVTVTSVAEALAAIGVSNT